MLEAPLIIRLNLVAKRQKQKPRNSFPTKRSGSELGTRNRVSEKDCVLSFFGGGEAIFPHLRCPFLVSLSPRRARLLAGNDGGTSRNGLFATMFQTSQSCCCTIVPHCINSPVSAPTGTSCPRSVSCPLAPRWVCCRLIYAHPCLSSSLSFPPHTQGNTKAARPFRGPTHTPPPSVVHRGR